jgi:transcriptional regulator with XRE-family HTH domain
MEIGRQIRRVRLSQGRTLAEVGAAAGVTRSLMSKIETGKTRPPVATLTRIAAALGASVAGMIDEGRARGAVYRPAGRAALTPTEKGYAFESLAAGRAANRMEPYLFEARRGAVRASPLQHGGDQWVYVLRGRMRYRVGEVTYRLGPGDSLYFDAAEEHDFEPTTAVVRFVGVFCGGPSAARPTGNQRKRRKSGE